MDDDALPARATLLETANDLPVQRGIVTPLSERVPQRGSALGRLIGRFGLALFGWKVVGAFPDCSKMVIIVAPHTSNWDFIVGFWAYLALDLHANWFGKHTLFVWPFGVLFRRFGGIPIHRQSGAAAQVVDAYVDAIRSRDRMVLAIAPEGTRRRVTEWKSGFHRIAQRAGVPIVPVALDYRISRIIVGPSFAPSEDFDCDVVRIKALYAGVTPRHPQLF